MKRIIPAVVLILAGVAFALPVRADAIDDAEAKKRGVAVEVVLLEKANARIAGLERKIAELQSAGKTPTTTPAAAAKAGAAGKKSRDDLPEYLQAYLKHRDEQFQTVIAGHKKTIESYEETIKKEGPSNIRAARIGDLNKSIDSHKKKVLTLTKDGVGKYVPTLQLVIKGGGSAPRPLVKVGDGGKLISTSGDADGEPTVSPFKIRQILGEAKALIEEDGHLFMVSGVSFKGMVNGAGFSTKTPLIAKETVTYTNIKGSTETVMQLEPFNPDDYKDY